MDSVLLTPLIANCFSKNDINTYARLKTSNGAIDNNLLLNIIEGDVWWQIFFQNSTADLTHINTTLNYLMDSIIAIIHHRGNFLKEYYFSSMTWTT